MLLLQKRCRAALWFVVCFNLFQSNSYAQQQADVPWTPEEALQPSSLAGEIREGATKDLLLLNIGPVNDIQGAVNIGSVNDESSRQKLHTILEDAPKDKAIVIYCGCCPMNHCPNIRPAYRLLKEEGFTNVKILDIEENLSEDWIDKGYPMEEDKGSF